ncbi:MAG: Nif3-like dinuclear metal center hexameric protein [Oscillospiraceae bacterium]|nr:Nif3-like dinuclear metal center hexameric protein [Oscillospiraceae bacterium]
MKATDLYQTLAKDFEKPGIVETWYNEDWENKELICGNFKERSMGLLCDFAENIQRVYTAVFPSDKVLAKVVEDGATDAMLFLHHPLAWDSSREPGVLNVQINSGLLEKLKANRVSLFNYHLPLDHIGEYSVNRMLANELGITIEKPFGEFGGAVCGILGTIDCDNVHELQRRFSKVIGHEAKLYLYGDEKIKDNRVGMCGGCGNDRGIVNQFLETGINTYITGVSINGLYWGDVHELQKAKGVNVLGGTHYSTEKFACMAMCEYFQKLGLPSDYVADVPCLGDL